jgi:hypothetical protein
LFAHILPLTRAGCTRLAERGCPKLIRADTIKAYYRGRGFEGARAFVILWEMNSHSFLLSSSHCVELPGFDPAAF